MKKATPGKVIITPRPPVGSEEESGGAEILLKSNIPLDLKPIGEDIPAEDPLDTSNEKAPDLGKVAVDLKDKAKPRACCKKPALNDNIKK